MKRLWTLLASTLAGVCWGCSDSPSNSPSTMPMSSTATPGEWLTVTSDPSAITAARHKADVAENEAYERIIAAAAGPGGFFDSETISILEEHRDDAIVRLKVLLSSAGKFAESVGAAQLLCRFSVPEGRAYLAQVLRDGKVTLRKHVLNAIDGGATALDDVAKQAYRSFLFEDAELVSGLLKQLEDVNPEIVTAAVQSCGILDVPGARERMLQLLDRRDLTNGGRVLYWLSKGPLSRDLFDKAKRVLQSQERRGPGDWEVSLFEAFARNDDPELRRSGRNELIRWLQNSREEDEFGFRGDRLGVLETLAKTSSTNDLEWLRGAVKVEHGLYARSLLTALIRLEGPKGKTRALQLLADPQRRQVAVAAAGEAFAGTADENILAALLRVARSAKDRGLNEACAALLSVGGDSARQEVRKLLPQLDVVSRASFLHRLDEAPLQLLKQRLADAGVLGAEAFEAASQRTRSDDTPEDAGAFGLLDVLRAAELVVEFDVETGMLPCRHDQLIMEFAKHSRNVFVPNAASEEWHQRHPEDFEADYTLRFVFDGRLYEGRMRNLDDWYDVERMVTMINRALRDYGSPDEFIPLATEGQIASFVFANRQHLEPLAIEFNLPLEADLNEPRRAGLEYEKKVFDKLKRRRTP